MTSDSELGYWAGMMDGEGSVMIGKTYHTNKDSERRTDYFLRCMISQNKKWVCEAARDFFGCGSAGGTKQTTTVPRSDKTYRSAMYYWHATTNDALSVLEMLLPHLKIKRPQVELALKFVSNLRETDIRGKRNEDGTYMKLSDAALAERESFYDRMKALNARA